MGLGAFFTVILLPFVLEAAFFVALSLIFGMTVLMVWIAAKRALSLGILPEREKKIVSCQGKSGGILQKRGQIEENQQLMNQPTIAKFAFRFSMHCLHILGRKFGQLNRLGHVPIK